MEFQLVSSDQPAGDQPKAIAALTKGLRDGKKDQGLWGITASGKTFTMANIIQRVKRPTVVMSHNKTLAAQLYGEFKKLFPHNAVQYFVSDYKYFYPQTYQPRTDKYNEKHAALDAELTRHRIAAAMAALARRDVIVVASVSCIFDIGSPQVCRDLALALAVGDAVDLESIITWLVEIGYEPAGSTLAPKTFRVRGAHIEVFTLYECRAHRIEVENGRVQRLLDIDPQSGETVLQDDRVTIYPARLHILRKGWIEAALLDIQEELDGRLQELQSQGKRLEAQRLEAATLSDMDNLRDYGRCSGMEVYCRALNRRSPGAPPDTVLDFFPKDLLVFVDESHVMLPQIRGMYEGSRNRMQDLVAHGYRLPGAWISAR